MSDDDHGGKSASPERGGVDTGVSRSDFVPDIMGNNSLQGNDQASVRNQRQAVPDVKQETDGVVESFEKLDKNVRAKEDLGKGNRHSAEHPYRKA